MRTSIAIVVGEVIISIWRLFSATAGPIPLPVPVPRSVPGALTAAAAFSDVPGAGAVVAALLPVPFSVDVALPSLPIVASPCEIGAANRRKIKGKLNK